MIKVDKNTEEVLVIGDVHGCFKTLEALLASIPDGHKKKICFVGDLIDRGPMSRQVVDFVIKNNYDCVLGNHESMMIDYSKNVTNKTGLELSNMWGLNGGVECLNSYREVDTTSILNLKGDVDIKLFELHKSWIVNLPLVIKYENIFVGEEKRQLAVSHSICHNFLSREKKGIFNPNDQYTIIWGRNFHTMKDSGFFNVFGHTIQEAGPKVKHIYANIDTGAFLGMYPDYKKIHTGKLTAMHFPSMTIYQQEYVDG